MNRLIPIIAVLALTSAACGGDDDGDAAAEPTKITIMTTEYGFSLPDTFSGGLVEITLDNTGGTESHEAEMIRLDAGKTQGDLLTALAAGGPPPAFAHASSGPGPVLPGETATYTANVDPGTYVFVCHVPAPDGQEHLQKGMIAQAEVSEGTSATLPASDTTITLKEFQFGGLETLKAGSQTVRVANEGTQDHHIAVVALAEGKTAADLAAFFAEEAPAGPPPFTGFPGLMATMAPGSEALRTLELVGGTTYAFACFIPDTDGTPHFAKGMAGEITV
ncbi:MAG TPA: hypothetical protein VGB52_07985 [Actinomycetota bacterium]